MKDLKYYKKNAEEDYLSTPISVLRYITELETKIKKDEQAAMGAPLQREFTDKYLRDR